MWKILLSTLCAASFLAAQAPPQDPPKTGLNDSEPIIRESFRYVLVPVTVTDRAGDIVNGLTPLDFVLTDNGKRQKITEDVATHPLSVVVAVQANADVEKMLPQIQKLSSVFESLVLGDNGELALVAFDHRFQELTGFTSDPAQIDAAFKKLKAGSYTSDLNDSAMQGIDMLRNRPPERRRVLVLISENRDKGSQIKPREVLNAAEFAQVVVYSVDISQLLSALTSQAQPNRPNPIPAYARQLPGGTIGTDTTDAQNQIGAAGDNFIPALKDIFLAVKGVFVPDPLDIYTRYTGGREFSFKTQKTLEKDIAGLGEELHSQYFLTYLPNNAEEPGFHQIVVTVNRPNLKVRARDGYYFAGEAQ